MNLPLDFIHNIHNAFGDEGRLWLVCLPALVLESIYKDSLPFWEAVFITSKDYIPRKVKIAAPKAKRPTIGPLNGKAQNDITPKSRKNKTVHHSAIFFGIFI